MTELYHSEPSGEESFLQLIIANPFCSSLFFCGGVAAV
jgi:hypothetical protein